MKEKLAHFKSCNISYIDNDSSTSEKVIFFIHGNSLNASFFENQFQNKQLNRFRLIAPDFPGHGSSEIKKNYEWQEVIFLLAEFIHSFQANSFMLCGHSLGGHIAIELSEVLHPAGLLLWGAPPVTSLADMPQAFQPSNFIQFLFKPELTPEEARQWAEGITDDESYKKKAKYSILKTDPKFREGIGDTLTTLKDEISILKSLFIPIALLHGEDDKIVNIEYVEKLELNLWQNKIHFIRSASHSPHFEQPAQFNSLLLKFAADVFK